MRSKKRKLGWLFLDLVSVCMLFCCTNPSVAVREKYSVGTPYQTACSAQEGNPTFFKYIRYAFWQEDGCDVAIHHGKTGDAVDQVLIQRSRRGSFGDFAALEYHAELLDVVAKVGNPVGPAAGGSITLLFQTSGGESLLAGFEEVDSSLLLMTVSFRLERSKAETFS